MLVDYVIQASPHSLKQLEAFGAALGAASGVAWGMAFGVAWGMTLGAAWGAGRGMCLRADHPFRCDKSHLSGSLPTACACGRPPWRRVRMDATSPIYGIRPCVRMLNKQPCGHAATRICGIPCLPYSIMQMASSCCPKSRPSHMAHGTHQGPSGPLMRHVSTVS